MLNQFDKRPAATSDPIPEAGPASPPGIASIADALREAARLAAVRDLLAEREQELRAWLGRLARAHAPKAARSNGSRRMPGSVT